jgi:hypothetical protein
MLSLKEKQEALAERWKAIHAVGLNLAAKSPADLNFSNYKLSAGNTLVIPEGVKNSNRQLQGLKGKIEWYGSVAVGENKNFDGWVAVVPPGNGSISYFGPEGMARARKMAQSLVVFYP